MMKRVVNMIVKALAVPFLAVPALISCMVETDESKIEAEKDAMVANYQVQGTVSDEEGNPIAGIRVIADHSTDVVYQADTLYTDKEGAFSKFLSAPRVDRFYMSFTDIDGQSNGGEFEARSEYVTPVRTEMSVGHFGGSYIVSYNAILKKK